jgi:predicted DNA-binding transcriptional regulator YafY
MNRTDRLLAIVLELQAKGTQRAGDLAATFETSTRTIYRDVQALSEAGVPVVAVPGRGYSLMAGYFLPPVSFTTDEATMLLLGADYMARSFDARYRAAAQTAGRKIEAVLPEPLRDEVRTLQDSLYFVAPAVLDNPAVPDLLQRLRGAIVERRTVRFRYHTRHPSQPDLAGADGDEPPIRQADPYGLVQFAGAWYVVAYSHERRAIRNFRLDRMEGLTLTKERFARPPGFSMPRGDRGEPRPLVVRALFDREVARWVRESRPHYKVAEAETPEGLLVTLQVRQESEVLAWLLGWGARVRVLEPESLRARLAEEAAGILRHHRTDMCDE